MRTGRFSHSIRPAAARGQLMKPRLWLTRHLGAPANAEPAAQAEDWLRGWADLLIAGMGGQVSVVVQLGVLAHADLGRLADLGRNSRRGSVRRAWGTEMARLAGDLAALAATPTGSLRCNAMCWYRSSLRCWPATATSPPVLASSAICETSFLSPARDADRSAGRERAGQRHDRQDYGQPGH